MKATELNQETFDATVNQSDRPVLVDFWAEWCGPCRMIGPVIEEIAAQQEGKAIIAKVNVDDSPELAARYDIASIPTLIVFKDGKPVTTFQGVHPKANITESLANAA